MSERPSYKTKEWLRFRLEILLRDFWLCRICGVALSEGNKQRYSAVVDHLEPVELRPDLFLDPDNVWSVCKHDHDSVCQSIEKRIVEPAKIRRAKLDYRMIDVTGYPVEIVA